MSALLTICLCFYADGPRADNLVRLPAFPTGVSYDRPFRYRDTWIQDDLLAELRADPKALNDHKVVLAMRFLDQALKDVLVPMRLGTLDAAALSPDNNQFYFRVGKFVDFANATDLQERSLTLAGPAAGAARDKLLCRIDVKLPSVAQTDAAEEASWTRLTNLIANSATFPVSDDARRALYLRVQPPRAKRRLRPKRVHHSWTSGNVYGFRLAEHSARELVVMHRLPVLIGTATQLGERQELCFKTDPAALVTTPAASEISANYDRHVITVSAQQRTTSWIQLRLDPLPEQVAANGIQILGYSIALPLRVRLAPFYRLRTQVLPILLVTAALFASSYYTVYKTSIHTNTKSGRATKSNPPYWPALIASTLASVIIFIFKK